MLPLIVLNGFFPRMLCTGDDDGVVKVRPSLFKICCAPGAVKHYFAGLGYSQQDVVRTYTHHFDFISDFLWIEDKREVVATR